MKQSEKKTEQYLGKEIQKIGGLSIKIPAIHLSGIPDRLVLLSPGICGFLELKSEGFEPRKLQWWWIDKLQKLGFIAEYADTKEKVDLFIQKLKLERNVRIQAEGLPTDGL